VTDGTFQRAVLASPLPVLVDCWAPWCGPCRTVAPVLDELARDYAGRVRIAKLNVDQSPSTAGRYAVQSIPTMLLFKDGREVDRLVGALPRARIEEALNGLL
jgi:thioredoxin 2